jgi:hypothetical protein
MERRLPHYNLLVGVEAGLQVSLDLVGQFLGSS